MSEYTDTTTSKGLMHKFSNSPTILTAKHHVLLTLSLHQLRVTQSEQSTLRMLLSLLCQPCLSYCLQRVSH